MDLDTDKCILLIRIVQAATLFIYIRSHDILTRICFRVCNIIVNEL